MHTKQSDKLTVSASGKTLLIEVPSGRAEALLRYLRSRGVSTSPPSPYRSGTDTIVLGRGMKAQAVQILLDQWA